MLIHKCKQKKVHLTLILHVNVYSKSTINFGHSGKNTMKQNNMQMFLLGFFFTISSCQSSAWHCFLWRLASFSLHMHTDSSSSSLLISSIALCSFGSCFSSSVALISYDPKRDMHIKYYNWLPLQTCTSATQNCPFDNFFGSLSLDVSLKRPPTLFLHLWHHIQELRL